MNRIKFLENEIIRHKSLYYQGHPEISDVEYDQLEEELKTLSPESAVLNLVGSLPKGSGKKVRHNTKMLSLQKTYKLEELNQWIGKEEVISTLKLDGVSCSLIYRDGKFFQGKTRGNGEIGEDITDKCQWINSIPKTIELTDEIEIRGEILCTYENFEQLKNTMEKMGLEKPNSPRNIVAGLISRKDNIHLCKYLTIKTFDLIGSSFSTEVEKINSLDHLGFDLAKYELHQKFSTVEDFISKAKEHIEKGKYQIDGIVFSYNRLSLHQELGETSHHPRYKIAFKFAGESKVAKIEEVLWDISRQGIYTPVAMIEPTELSGAMISRVTLHNYGIASTNKLKKGDLINVIRSGEVIPKFLSVEESNEGAEFEHPTSCYYCHSELIINDIRLICENKNCPGKIKHQILNFIQKIGIDDLSEKRLEQLLESKLVQSIPDLYRLSVEDFLSLPKTKDKLANKIIESIQSTKAVDLVTFLSALGISGGAKNKNEKIVFAGYSSLNSVLDLTVEQLTSIEGFAEKSSTEYINSLNEKKSLINELLDLGVQVEEHQQKNDSDLRLNNLKFVITGILSRKRSEIESDIKANGGDVGSSVTSKTSYLVCNDKDSSSSKTVKAKKLGVPIISEEELQALIN